MTKVNVGEVAPDFTLPDQDGKPVSLSSLKGKVVILFFYPKDFSAGCTREVCHFRDSYEDFSEAGAEVIGISSDTIESHKKFIETYLLPYSLLSDREGKAKKIYGVSGHLLPGRVTFIIDKVGVIRHVFSSQTNMKAHVDEALKIIKTPS
ncbi:MAG: peroxiredoxin [Candidatus Bathyarchaeota archaeon]|nr:peroxiredoxin [Candidatus Bathyarchaeota archaeon]